MEAELRLHNLRDLLRVGEVEGHGRKVRVEDATAGIAQFTTIAGGAGVFGVETCQRGKRRLALLHTLGILAQLVLHAVDLLRLYTRCLRDDLHLYLRRHEGQAVLRHVAEVAAHLGGCHLQVFHQLLLHLLHHHAIAVVVVQLRTHLTDRHFLILFQLLARASHLRPRFYLLVDARGNL